MNKKSNFLNNQNYILGKTEKKKLLVKFFMEKSINKIFKILMLINNITHNYFSVLFLILIILLGIFYSKSFFTGLFIFPFVLAYPPNYNKKRVRNKKKFIGKRIKNSTQIISIKNYIFNDFSKLNNISEMLIIGIKTIFTYLYFYHFLDFINISLAGFNLFLLTNLIVIFIINLKITNLLFLPFFMVYEFFVLLSSILYIFILKGIKGYIFVKKHFDTDLLNRFSRIDDELAENKDYIIKLKV